MPLVNGNRILELESKPEPEPFGLLLIIIVIIIAKFCTPKSEVTYLPDPGHVLLLLSPSLSIYLPRLSLLFVSV